jgi:hypothetical protein
MPHAVEQHVEQQYEMLMPILAKPNPYWRYPNATEAYRSMHRSPSTKGAVVIGPGSSPLATQQHSSAVANMIGLGQTSAGSGASFHAHAAMDRVVTDDSGLQLLQSTVRDEDGKVTRVLESSELDVRACCFCTIVIICMDSHFRGIGLL